MVSTHKTVLGTFVHSCHAQNIIYIKKAYHVCVENI